MAHEELSESIINLMKSPAYQPMSKSEMARALEIPSKRRLELRDTIDRLEHARVIVHLKKGRFALKRSMENLVPGRIKVLYTGKILFIPDQSALVDTPLEGVKEIVVYPAYRLNSALDGDLVKVQTDKSFPKGWRKRHKGRPSAEEMDLKVRVREVTHRARDK